MAQGRGGRWRGDGESGLGCGIGVRWWAAGGGVARRGSGGWFGEGGCDADGREGLGVVTGGGDEGGEVVGGLPLE